MSFYETELEKLNQRVSALEAKDSVPAHLAASPNLFNNSAPGFKESVSAFEAKKDERVGEITPAGGILVDGPKGDSYVVNGWPIDTIGGTYFLNGYAFAHKVDADAYATSLPSRVDGSGSEKYGASDWTSAGQDSAGFPVEKGSPEDVTVADHPINHTQDTPNMNGGELATPQQEG